jgi:hypothetical protein
MLFFVLGPVFLFFLFVATIVWLKVVIVVIIVVVIIVVIVIIFFITFGFVTVALHKWGNIVEMVFVHAVRFKFNNFFFRHVVRIDNVVKCCNNTVEFCGGGIIERTGAHESPEISNHIIGPRVSLNMSSNRFAVTSELTTKAWTHASGAYSEVLVKRVAGITQQRLLFFTQAARVAVFWAFAAYMARHIIQFAAKVVTNGTYKFAHFEVICYYIVHIHGQICEYVAFYALAANGTLDA